MATRQSRRPLTPVRVAIVWAIAVVPFLSLLATNGGHAPATARVLVTLEPPASTVTPLSPHTVTYDRYSLLIDGRRVVLFGGEYQFWRTPAPARWPVILREMRAAGLNTVSVGVSWQYHSPAPGVYDFSGIRDLGRFLDDAAAAGLYVIARPGPVYNAESSASNLPGWLLERTGNLRANSGPAYCGVGANDLAYAAAYTDWYRHVLPIIAARQITSGRGTVVALQIENEYSPLCGSAAYMSALHDLARQDGIDVPLIANNNSCCIPSGAWHAPGDDGQPVVDIPAEDDYPCGASCTPSWDARIFATVDGLEERLRHAGVTEAPVAIAELQGGYYVGWTGSPLGRDYTAVNRTLGPAFAEALDGSVLGQGATIVSIYMAAGGTSWGYLAGPDTETSYDYDAAIHEWGQPGTTYDALKRTAMFVDAFGDLLGATRRTAGVTASNGRLLYAARETVDGPQRGAQFIVLRNGDSRHTSSTRLRLPVAGHYVTVPQAPGSAIVLPPRGLALLVAGYHLGPCDLLYSTSRLLTQATVNGQKILVLYGAAGTPGETALTFRRRPTLLRVDRGIRARYDGASGELLLDYHHTEGIRYVVVAAGRARLVLALTGVQGAARTWRVTTPAGPALVMGPSMVTAAPARDGSTNLQIELHGATAVSLWAPQPGGRRHASASTFGLQTLLSWQDEGSRREGIRLRPLPGQYDVTIGAATTVLDATTPTLHLPALSTWRFKVESPEILPSFDDRSWVRATERATSNPNVPAGDTLLADDYGFHYGFVWYRGHFTGTGAERGLQLLARNSYSVWLNGTYLGSSTLHNDLKDVNDELSVHRTQPSNSTYADPLTFPIAPGLIKPGSTNTIAVLTESLGHNIGFANGQLTRSPMGILSAQLIGSHVSPPISWRLQGGVGHGTDSPLNASGLYGERQGWYLPAFDDHTWSTVSKPDSWVARGLHWQGVGWYRTTFDLNVPAGLDAPLALYIPHAQDKAVIWLNGLLIGRYWEQAGPQHLYYLPAGLLREHGRNTLAIAVWNRGHDGGLPAGVALRPYTVATDLSVAVGS